MLGKYRIFLCDYTSIELLQYNSIIVFITNGSRYTGITFENSRVPVVIKL